MKVIKESFNVSVEDIYRCLHEVEEAHSNYKSALDSLSYYVTNKYPQQGKKLSNDIEQIENDDKILFETILEIKELLDTKKGVEESMKVIKESVDQSTLSKMQEYIDRGRKIIKQRLLLAKEMNSAFSNKDLNKLYDEAEGDEIDKVDELIAEFRDVRGDLNSSYSDIDRALKYYSDIQDESLKESKLNEEADDGWSEDIKYQLEDVLERAYNLQYEVNNCVRGAYTGCNTSEELSEYVKDLGEDFTLIGEDLPNYPAYDELGESLLTEAPTGKMAKQIAQLVKSGVDFNDAVDQIAERHHMTRDDIGLPISIAKDFLGMDDNKSQGKWKHQLPENTAKSLRQAIDEGDYDGVRTMLQQAWKEVNEIVPDSFDEFDLSDKLNEIDMIDNDEYIEDELDNQLSDFYDFCDAESIWIPLS